MKNLIWTILVLIFESCINKSYKTDELMNNLLVIDSLEILTTKDTINLKRTASNDEDIYDLLITFHKNQWLIGGEADYGLENKSMEEKICFANGVNPLRYSEELFPIETIINNLKIGKKENYKIIEQIIRFKIGDRLNKKINNSDQLRFCSDSISNDYLKWVKNKDGTDYKKGKNPELKKIIDYYCYILDNDPQSILIFSVGSTIHIYQLLYFKSNLCRISKYNFHSYSAALR